jgi:hypothetical protein
MIGGTDCWFDLWLGPELSYDKARAEVASEHGLCLVFDWRVR